MAKEIWKTIAELLRKDLDFHASGDTTPGGYAEEFQEMADALDGLAELSRHIAALLQKEGRTIDSDAPPFHPCPTDNK